ncbi:BTB/POZ and MATH domain-containing protein 1-like [Triticum urartu]|uniref:BTB/POZ and MATH domain-containing protein 1-like n=1 Tax=Triticum urartu TaxID=4572 RepID=UPI00204499DE|nr:BTB/POZ and MATH domain-containing protein 1-like [Triticum urartu]
MAAAVADGELSRSAIVSDRARGRHLLTIHGYSDTRITAPTGKCVKSRPFTIGGHRWRIGYYPNGLSSAVEDYVSLSLVLDEDVAAAVKAQFSFCLAGDRDECEEELWQELSLTWSPVKDFASWSGWEHPKLIKSWDLQSSEHLNVSFTIRCDIIVFHDCRAVDDAAAFVSVPPCDLRQHLSELLESDNGADVVFEVGSKIVCAHRCVLAARSPVFAAELFGPMKKGNVEGVIRVEDIEPDLFKALLHFAYPGSLPEMSNKEDEEAVYQHLLVAADRYDMRRLKLICEEKLCKYIEVGTVATILALAEQHRCEGLKKACLEFLTAPNNVRALVATDGFKHLSTSCPSIMVALMAMLRIS